MKKYSSILLVYIIYISTRCKAYTLNFAILDSFNRCMDSIYIYPWNRIVRNTVYSDIYFPSFFLSIVNIYRLLQCSVFFFCLCSFLYSCRSERKWLNPNRKIWLSHSILIFWFFDFLISLFFFSLLVKFMGRKRRKRQKDNFYWSNFYFLEKIIGQTSIGK